MTTLRAVVTMCGEARSHFPHLYKSFRDNMLSALKTKCGVIMRGVEFRACVSRFMTSIYAKCGSAEFPVIYLSAPRFALARKRTAQVYMERRA